MNSFYWELSQKRLFGDLPGSSKRKSALFSSIDWDSDRSQTKTFGSLSGGLAQRALLARALLSDPDLLLFDEPTANIDAPSIAVIFDLLESLKGKKTIFIVTHDLRTIIERVDRVLCVQGQVSSLLPKDVCEHFAMGLYHTPLLQIPSKKGACLVP